MSSENELTRLRQAFRIPESVVIRYAQTFAVNNTPVKKEGKNAYDIPKNEQGDAPLEMSALNTPVYSNIIFQGGRYETNVDGVFKTFPTLKYNAVLISVTQAKKLVKTEISGKDGTVKEYIGMDDYQIQINGIITGSNGKHPVDEILDLKRMTDAPIEIDVASSYLQNLGVFTLVVEEAIFNQEAGGHSYQTFTLNCSSDVPVELRLSNV